MSPTTAASLSGLRAAQSALGVAAHNIANAGTIGFQRQTVQAATALPGGVSVSVGQSAEPGADMVADLVASLQARNSFVANLQAFRTGAQTVGSLLDVRG